MPGAVALHEPRLFATDVDGTLFNSEHKLTPAAEAAIVAAREAGVRVVIATGKGPGPWSDELLPRLRAMPGPGAPAILMQGLLVLAEDGSVMRRQLLDQDLACELLLLGDTMRGEGMDVNVFGYGAERILCPAIDRHAEGSAAGRVGQLHRLAKEVVETMARARELDGPNDAIDRAPLEDGSK